MQALARFVDFRRKTFKSDGGVHQIAQNGFACSGIAGQVGVNRPGKQRFAEPRARCARARTVSLKSRVSAISFPSSSSGFKRLQIPDLGSNPVLLGLQIVSGLQIHPELRRGTEIMG